MKYLIASDLHGSVRYVDQLLDRFENEGAQQLILLGDLLYHGPRNDLPGGYDTRAVAAMLNEFSSKILAVRGNCEAEVDQVMLNFPCMADYFQFIIGDTPFFATHGHLYNNDNLPTIATPGMVLLHGHTHIPANERYRTHRYMNPGSVSIPKAGSDHSYMLIDDDAIYWRNLSGVTYMEDVL